METQRTHRTWVRVLDDKQPRVGQKVKELVIKPKEFIDQKYMYRNEFCIF